MKIKQSIEDTILDIIVYTIVTLFSLSVIIPFWNLFVISVTPISAVSLKFQMLPKVVDFVACKTILQSDFMWNCFLNTVVRTVLGTLISIALTVTFTYPLLIKSFPFRNTILMLVAFTMFFDGGLIPGFLLVKRLGFINKLWALILPGAISAFNVIILKNFFNSIPSSLAQSAKIDGANDMIILVKIIIPLSLPIIATLKSEEIRLLNDH